MVNKIGIIQGRLTEPKGRHLVQFMPYGEEILEEFERAKFLGLNYVEWIVLKGVFNPFMGNFYDQERIMNLIKHSRVPINCICLDYLMDLDFSKEEFETILAEYSSRKRNFGV